MLSIAAGDEDGDQDADLVFARGNNVVYTSGRVALQRNEGSLVFTEIPFPSAAESSSIDIQEGLLVDLDGDQDLDYLRNGARVVLGDGQGAFASLDGTLVGTYDALLADVDGDGDAELIQSRPLRIQQIGASGLEPATVLPFDASALSAGDLDQDGDADLLAGSSKPEGGPALLLGDGTGGFADASASLPPLSPSESRLADVDGDGDLDGLVSTLILNQGAAVFIDGSALLGGSPRGRGAEFADVDADGDVDLVFASDHLAVPIVPAGEAVLLRNDGPLGFVNVTGVQLVQPAANAVAAGDVDVDGDTDLVFARAGGDHLQVNNGAGFFSNAAGALPVENQIGWSAVLFDADGDDDPDLFVGNPFGPSWMAGQSSLLVNNGAGVFASVPGGLPGDGFLTPLIVLPPAADFDRDGDVDLFVGDPLGLLANTARHVAWTKPARLGRPLELALRGDASTPWTLLASTQTVEVDLGALGILGVDPSHPVSLTTGLLDAAGEGAAAFAVPSDPTLAGASLYWQATVGAPQRLTNVERTTFTDL